MPNPLTLRCPHCGEIDWTQAPRLRHALDFVEGLDSDRFHAADYRASTGGELTAQSVTNAMRDLERLGFIRRDGTDAAPTGGRQIAWLRTLPTP